MRFVLCIVMCLSLETVKLTVSSPHIVDDNKVSETKATNCGIPREIPQSYFRHKNTDLYKFNWMVLIDETLNSNNSNGKVRPLYDGILIHPRVVLTNARSLESMKGPLSVKISKVDLSLSGFGLEETQEEETQVTDILIHPQYNKCSLKNDLALLILERSFNSNQYSNTICLPNHEQFVDMQKYCSEIQFSLNFRPFERNCEMLTIVSYDEFTDNPDESLNHPDTYAIRYLPSKNQTEQIHLRIDTTHVFCNINGDSSQYFYGGMRTYLHSSSQTTFVTYTTNDKISDHLNWINTILSKKFGH